MVDLQNKSEKAVSNILSSIVSGLSKSETESKKKTILFSSLINFQMDTEYKYLKYPI